MKSKVLGGLHRVLGFQGIDKTSIMVVGGKGAAGFPSSLNQKTTESIAKTQ